MKECSKSKKISIIIPVYNAEKFISKTLQSLIVQFDEYSNFEIIIVNDGSTDDSNNIINKIIKDNKEIDIKLFDKKNEGVSIARNYGIEKSSGDYIVFLDADDELKKGALKKIGKVIEEEYDLILFNYEYLDYWKNKKERILYKEKSKKVLLDILQQTAIETEKLNSVWQFCISKKFIEKNGIKFKKGIKVGEDLLFNLELLSNNPKSYYLNEILYKYNYNQESVMNYNTIKNVDKRLHDSTDIYFENLDYIKVWNKNNALNRSKIASKYFDLLHFEFNQLIDIKESWKEKKILMKKYTKSKETLIMKKYVNIKNFIFKDKFFILLNMLCIYFGIRKIKINLKNIERKLKK